MVVRVTGFSSGAFLQLPRVDGGCIQRLDLSPAPWASWELHATGGIFASAYGSHGVAPPPQVKRQFLFPWTSCGLWTPCASGCLLLVALFVIRSRRGCVLPFYPWDLCNVFVVMFASGLGAELWVQDLR